MQAIDSNSDVVMIGAGPVGLFTAIQTKLMQPKVEIALLDRFDKYVRKQTLSIQSSSFKNVCDLNKLKQQRPEYISQIDDLAKLILEIKSKKKIKINDLETRLRQIAEDLNIRIHTGYTFQVKEQLEPSDQDLVGIKDVKKAFPNAKIIVGSDGAHSKVREAVFHNDFKVDEGLQHTIAIRYWVKNESEPLKSLVAYPTHKVVGLAQEHVGKYDAEKDATPVTVQFFVDKNTFEKFKEYKAGNPLALSAVKDIDANLEKKIRIWLNVREKQLEDKLEGEVDVYTIKLPIYQSRRAVHQNKDETVCLVGDAFFGVPYYRSINNGFLCASQLSKAISSDLYPSSPPSLWERVHDFMKTLFMSKDQAQAWRTSPFKRYEMYAEGLATQEIRSARIKNWFVNFYQWWIRISSTVPWQTNKWGVKDIQRFELSSDPIVNEFEEKPNPKIFDSLKLSLSKKKS